MALQLWRALLGVVLGLYVATLAHAALGRRFIPPVDRSIEPVGNIRFYAVSISWPCAWLSAVVVPDGDKLKVGAPGTNVAYQNWFSYSEDSGFMSNNNQYLYLDPEAHSVTLVPVPHPEVVWRNGTVAYKVDGTEGNITYGASLAACPIEGQPFQFTIEYNSSCTGGHRVQLRAIGRGAMVDYMSEQAGRDVSPFGSAQDRGAAKKGAAVEKRDQQEVQEVDHQEGMVDDVVMKIGDHVEGSPEFEEQLRLRLMGLID